MMESISETSGDSSVYTSDMDVETRYIDELKCLYASLTTTKTSDLQWPPPCTHKVFNLAIIKEEVVKRSNVSDSFVRMSITGKLDDILHVKTPIELVNIFNGVGPNKRKVVLMEGAPGCGKSTLSNFITQQWGEDKIFAKLQFKAVVLVQLRDPVIQKAKSIIDLFPSGDDITVVRKAEESMRASKYQDVLFILDGWDELHNDLREDSIFRKLIEDDQAEKHGLDKSAVIVTSRPVASGDLHKFISTRVEILGFTPEELQNYFRECLEGNSKAVKTLLERIEENPEIAGTCYLPLNASILVHLFKHSHGSNLPTSQYGIFSQLICTCISRHLKERTLHRNVTLETLDQLVDTETVKEPFRFLCDLAYDGVMNDRITFSSLPDNTDTLSILQGVESFVKHDNKIKSYNFIHLSIQELLAAFYMMQWLPPDEQVAKFNDLFDNPRFNAVFQFYSAMTKLKTPGISGILTKVAEQCSEQSPEDDDKILLVALFHCLNAAQDPSLCKLIMKYLQHGLNLGHTTLTPTDCLCIGYFLSCACNINTGTSDSEFKAKLYNCDMGDKGCKYLVRGLQKHMTDSNYAVTRLYMDLKWSNIHEEGSIELSKLLQYDCVNAFNLNGNEELSNQGAFHIAEKLKTNTSLTELQMYTCGLAAKGVRYIAGALEVNNSLKMLNLGGNGIYDDGVKYLASALSKNHHLKSLELSSCGMTDQGLKHIADSLQHNRSLEELKLYNFLNQKHLNEITVDGDAMDCLIDTIGKTSAIQSLVLPQEFKKSLSDIQEGVNEERKFHKLAGIIKVEVKGQTLNTIMGINHDSLLTESELRILSLALAEHLPKLKEQGLNLDPYYRPSNEKDGPHITKEEVIVHLEQIDQYKLAEILSEDKGVQLVQEYVFNNVYKKALLDEKCTVRLQVFRMVLCGVPRSGKTTFWKRLAMKDFEPSKESVSTGAAESHLISAQEKESKEVESDQEPHINAEMLFDLQLLSEDTEDLNCEALTIYKHILEAQKLQAEMYKPHAAHKPQDFEAQTYASGINLVINTSNIKDTNSLPAATKSEKDRSANNRSLSQSEVPAALPAVNQQPKSVSREEQPPDSTFTEIDKLFKQLTDLLQKCTELPDIPNIKKMCHLQDAGGQRAFLELLPTLSVGKALYLLFFNYEDFKTSVCETVQMKGSPNEVPTGAEYEQIDVIMQSLICVSTATTESSKNVALLVGTHVDKVTPKDVRDVTDIVYERVKPFLNSTLVYAESGDQKSLKEQLVLKVATKENSICTHEPEYYGKVVMDIVNNELKCPESEELPASWYMFIVILRRVQSAGYSVLRYKHCQHIADRLNIRPSVLKGLLFRLQKVFGIVLYFPEVEGLEDIVICDPAFVYKNISDLIFKSFRNRTDVSLSHQLKKWGMFKYEELEKRCKNKKHDLEINKLIILLKHLGIIAPVQYSTQSKMAVSEHENKAENHKAIRPEQEYVIPCVLKDAKQKDLKVQLQDTQACSIVPLRIYFDCGFPPMGGFCYLFTKLISDNKGWKLCLPDKWEDENNIYWRNKVTFDVEFDDHNYLVMLLSTDKYYEIHIIHSVSEQPFQLGKDGHDICKYVWKAICTILESSPNKSLQAYEIACICTVSHLETDQHVMKFECKPHEILSRVKAKCEKTSCPIPTDDMQPSIMVWFKKPQILKKGKLSKKVDLCIKDLLFKTRDGRKSPKYEWRVDGQRIEADNDHYKYKSDKNTFELSILHFESKFQGVYECVISTTEQPTLSTAVEVTVESDDKDSSADKCESKEICGHDLCRETESKRESSSGSVIREYRTITSCTVELRNAVKDDLTGLSGHLFAEELISGDNCSELRNRYVEEADRAARLVELVQRRIELDPQNYFKFIGILERNSQYYSSILRTLKDKYYSQEPRTTNYKNIPSSHANQPWLDHKDSLKADSLQNVETDRRNPLQDMPTKPKRAKLEADEDAILNIKNVYNRTEHVVDWFGLGTQLEITNSRLKKIERENDTEDGRRREMIVSWLCDDPEASWEKLSKALERVGHRILAVSLLQQTSRGSKPDGPSSISSTSSPSQSSNMATSSSTEVAASTRVDRKRSLQAAGVTTPPTKVAKLSSSTPTRSVAASQSAIDMDGGFSDANETSGTTCDQSQSSLTRCGVEVPAKEEMTFNSSMSEKVFFKWLKSRGVSEKDCKTLSENGVTPLIFVQSDAEDFDDIGLTSFGKKRVLETLAKVKPGCSESVS